MALETTLEGELVLGDDDGNDGDVSSLRRATANGPLVMLKGRDEMMERLALLGRVKRPCLSCPFPAAPGITCSRQPLVSTYSSPCIPSWIVA